MLIPNNIVCVKYSTIHGYKHFFKITCTPRQIYRSHWTLLLDTTLLYNTAVHIKFIGTSNLAKIAGKRGVLLLIYKYQSIVSTSGHTERQRHFDGLSNKIIG